MRYFYQRLRHSITASVVLVVLALIAGWHGIQRVSGQNAVATVSAASYQSLLSPDSIAAAYGTGLATQFATATSLPLPTNLGGTTVRVNDVLARLLFVSPTQINFVIPSETATGTARVVVTAGTPAIIDSQVASDRPAKFLQTLRERR